MATPKHDGHGPEIEDHGPQRLRYTEGSLADPMRQRSGKVIAQVAVRVILQVRIERTRHRLPLARPEYDLTAAAGPAEDHLADTQTDEQPQRPAQTLHERKRMFVRLCDGLDHLPGRVGNQNAAGRIDRLEHHHREIPPAVACDEMADEAERRRRQWRCARRALKFGTRVHVGERVLGAGTESMPAGRAGYISPPGCARALRGDETSAFTATGAISAPVGIRTSGKSAWPPRS